MRALWSAGALVALAGCSSEQTPAPIAPEPAPQDGGTLPKGDGGSPSPPVSDASASRQDASAPPGAPPTAKAKCKAASDAGSSLYFAEQAYPGRTALELAFVKGLVPLAPGEDSFNGLYPYLVQTTRVRDGFVAVLCGGAATADREALFVGP